MSITRAKASSIRNSIKYNNFDAGYPNTPIIGTATDGGTGTTASVAFTTNNTAGLTYTVLSSPGSFTGTSTISPITVTGLTAGTAYTFTVKATNSAGDSPASAASNSVTPVVPTAYESIATANGTGSSGTITFSSIPSTYTHLQIRYMARSADANTSFKLTFNGSTTGYADHTLYGTSGGTVGPSGNASATSFSFLQAIAPSTSSANIMGGAIIDIHNYASTTRNKTLRVITGYDTNSADPGGVVILQSGLWVNTSAITSISLFKTSGNLTNNSTFALYGIKG